MTLDTRPEGVYCRWESYPPAIDPHEPTDNIVHVPRVPRSHKQEFTETFLHIERVGGDGSVSKFECGLGESWVIFEFLGQAKIYGAS